MTFNYTHQISVGLHSYHQTVEQYRKQHGDPGELISFITHTHTASRDNTQHVTVLYILCGTFFLINVMASLYTLQQINKSLYTSQQTT